MASKSTGKDDAVRNFEEWRKSKASATDAVAQSENSVGPVVEEVRVEKKPEPTEPENKGPGFFSKAGAAVSSFGKTVVDRIGLLFAAKDTTEGLSVESTSDALTDAEVTSNEVDEADKLSAKKTKAAEKEAATPKAGTESKTSSLWAKISEFFAGLRAKVANASPRTKRITLASIVAGIVVVVFIAVFAKFEFVTVDGGIETTLGDAEEATFLIEKADSALQNDLVVAVQPGGIEGDAEALMVGTVFSFNEETYALYDGEVIWQIPLSDLKGKVLFATATQLIP